jgi:hypothetical protein
MYPLAYTVGDFLPTQALTLLWLTGLLVIPNKGSLATSVGQLVFLQ